MTIPFTLAGAMALLATVLAPALALGSDGAELAAPANTWTMRGGSPTRSGAAMTPPIRENPETAWGIDVSGKIAAEPLVQDDLIFLEVETKNGKAREIQIIRLFDGQPAFSKKSIATQRPLQLSVLGRSILAQTAADRLQIFTTPKTKRSLSGGWKLSADAPLFVPIMVAEDEIYVRTATNHIERYKPGESEPTWSTGAARGTFRGELSIRGDHVYVVEYSNAKLIAQLVALERETGKRISATELGQHLGGAVPEDSAHISTTHLLDLITVRHAMPVMGAEGNYIATGLKPGNYGQTTFFGLLNLATDPIAQGSDVVGIFTDGGLTLERLKGLTSGVELASARHHSWILEDGVPPTLAGDTVYLGDKAFDLLSGDVLWSKDLDVSLRAIPARETVLLVTDDRTRLVALRPPTPPTEPGDETASGGEFWGRIARRDGSIESGTLLLDAQKRTVQRTKGRTKPTELSDVLAIVDRGGALLFAPDGRSTTAGLRYLNDHQKGDDASLIAAYDAAIDSHPDREPAFALALTEATLQLDPKHKPAARRIREWLPEGITPTDPMNAVGWLEFLKATANAPVTMVKGDFKEGDADLTRTQRQLGATRAHWRDDLQALESDTLLVMTPLVAPGRIARCMAMGELVCDALEDIFSSGAAKRDSRFPLQLQLFESQEEYIDYNSKDGTDPALLEWTSGHYDPQSDVSRIFLPEDRRAFERVMQVYAHELTHHWLQQRCPLYAASEGRHSIKTPGYWVVEGFASLVEEFRFDIDSRSYEAWNPRADSLDAIAHTTTVHNWASLLAVNQIQFHGISTEPSFEITTRWTLGTSREQSHRTLFYHQSTAVCQYLFHAEGGKYRPKLLELVRRYYTGEYKPGAVEELIGLDPDSLGEKIRVFAQQAVQESS